MGRQVLARGGPTPFLAPLAAYGPRSVQQSGQDPLLALHQGGVDLVLLQFPYRVFHLLFDFLQPSEDLALVDLLFPPQLFEVYKAQKADLLALKEKHGAVVKPDTLSA